MKNAIIKTGILIVLIISFAFSQAYKGKSRLSGVVQDEEGHLLEGVVVKLFNVKAGDGFEVITDKKGEWNALWIRGGSWNVDFAKEGYVPQKITVSVREGDKANDINIKLKKLAGLSVKSGLKEGLEGGNKLYHDKKYEQAIKAYQDILLEYPDAYIIHINIGNSLYQLGRYDEAVESYKSVLAHDDSNVEAMIAIGNRLFNLGRSEDASEWYNKVKFEEIQDVSVLYNLGNSFYENSRLEEALKYYQRAVEIQNDFLEARYQLGLTLVALGKNEDALGVFEEYLKLDPDSAKAEQVKGFIQYIKKETDDE